MRSSAAAASGAMAVTMRTAAASQLEGKDMFNGEDMGCEDMGCEDMGKIRIRAGSDISPRSRQMKGAARQPRAYGTNPAITPKLARSFPFPSEARVQRPHAESTAGSSQAAAAATIYAVAFVTGAIVMSFEMLGSRYLNPYFGSGIYTWAALISTVLLALTLGYFLGGYLADRTASTAVLALTVIVGSVYLLALPSFAQPVLEYVLAAIDDVRAGSLVSALAIMVFPVTFLGMYSPFAIRLLLRSAQNSGRVSGAVYGISTVGSIAGTLGTTFVLIPTIGSRAITITLGALGVVSGLA